MSDTWEGVAIEEIMIHPDIRFVMALPPGYDAARIRLATTEYGEILVVHPEQPPLRLIYDASTGKWSGEPLSPPPAPAD